VHAVAIDLDPAYDRADEVASAKPVKLIEATADLRGKVLQATDHK